MARERKIFPIIFCAAIFILMEVAAVHMLRNNAALQDIWISRGAHKVMSALWGSSESVRQYFSLRKQNDALAAENFALREQLDRYRDLTLPDSLLVRTEGGFSYLPAEVRKVSRNKQHNYMLINKGYEDGVQESSGIITAHGVIGFIDAVEKHLSYARTFARWSGTAVPRAGPSSRKFPSSTSMSRATPSTRAAIRPFSRRTSRSGSPGNRRSSTVPRTRSASPCSRTSRPSAT